MSITIGKFRHLMQCSTPSGKFVILAIDHRGNLLPAIQKSQKEPVTEADLSRFKVQVMAHLCPISSAVLVDPGYGILPGVLSGAINGDTGLLSPIEVTDYSAHASEFKQSLMEGWSVDKAKRAGVNGIKLMLYYHPEAKDAAERREFIQQVIDACTVNDIPFFFEPIAFSLDPAKGLAGEEYRQVVIESARVFSPMGIDILKSQFPIDANQNDNEDDWRAAVRELDAACQVPWALLSAGADYEVLRRQTQIACEGGASGVMVGRGIWNEATGLAAGQERTKFLTSTAHQRMRELAIIVENNATSWMTRVETPAIDFDWYHHY